MKAAGENQRLFLWVVCKSAKPHLHQLLSLAEAVDIKKPALNFSSGFLWKRRK